MQEKDNARGKNYLNENGIMIVKKKCFRKKVVPISLRRKLLSITYEKFGHPGIKKMLNLISPNYYWPDMTQDVTDFIKHCDICQINK